MISPGVFIPLFEENGLIQQVDDYVWREAGAQIRKWHEKYGVWIPVSVNVSRVDLYDPEIRPKFAKILADNNNITAASKINIPMRWFSLVLFIRLFLLESS
jgi:EAL domain-containing protein (putative c-di-GMP-specific phosphodiesterase class I)